MTSLTDDFNRADSTTTLGANWTNQLNAVGINTNAAYPATASSFCLATHVTPLGGDDFQADIVLGTFTVDREVTIIGGANSAGESAIAVILNGNAAASNIYTQTTWAGFPGTSRAVAGSAPSVTAGDTLSLKRVGNLYTVLKNGTLITGMSWTDGGNVLPRDSSHRLVGVGARDISGYRRIDSFTATDGAAPTGAVLFF